MKRKPKRGRPVEVLTIAAAWDDDEGAGQILLTSWGTPVRIWGLEDEKSAKSFASTGAYRVVRARITEL